MLILGVETAGQRSSLALLRDEQLLGETSLVSAGRPQAERLLLAVRELCAQQGVSLHEVELLAISRGPGSFTGLRVGLVFAKTFAYASRRCALKAVETFAATVFLLPEQADIVEVVEDLRQGFVACQQFQWEETGWTPLAPMAAVPFVEWKERSRENVCLTGGGIERLRKQMPEKQFPASWGVLPSLWQAPDARAVALLGRREFLAQGGDDPFRVVPLYLRRSAAEEKLESAAS